MRLAIEIGRMNAANKNWASDWVRHAEGLGVDMAFSSEAWWSDSVTGLGYLAGRTERITLATGIMQVGVRSAAMTAMTALTLHDLSDGRFALGLGASGPQVIEGMHGVSYRKPLTRLRETVEVCRMVFAGEKIRYDGDVLQLPLPGGEGKAIRVDHEPVHIPIYLATLGPNALRYTGAAADGWLGTSFSPNRPGAHFDYLKAGAEQAGRSLDAVDLGVSVRIEIGDDVEGMIAKRKAGVAFNMGGMGSATTNFYNDAFKRAGFAEDALAIQAHWLKGEREAAAARVPDAMVTDFQAIGTREMVRERLALYRDAGVTMLKLGLDAVPPGPERLAHLEDVVDLVRTL